MAVDADSRVIIWNPAAEKMFGWTEDEVLGKPYPAVARDKWAAHIDVRDRTMRGEAVTGVEVQRVTRSGAIIDVALSIAPLRDAYGKAYATVGLMADITERKRVAERLRLHGSALEAAANGIMITDRAGIILWVNTAFTTLPGYAIEEVNSPDHPFSSPESRVPSSMMNCVPPSLPAVSGMAKSSIGAKMELSTRKK